MAESGSTPNYERIYDDANYFINAIVSDYGFYDDFIKAVRNGGANLEVKRKRLKKQIETSWVETIEESLSALDAVVRTPSKEIEEREEIMPIELSHNIGVRSIRHLAQHTDLINRIEGDMIIPSKILNVFHDETIITYENKFINTLIHRLFAFINKRYTKLMEDGINTTNIYMDFQSDFRYFNSNGKIHINMEVSDDSTSEGSGTNGSNSIFERVDRLNSVVLRYMESDFVKSMGQNFVRPPIMRTNAITKNKDLRQCLILWEFIETYEKIGYTIDVNETVEKPDDEYINSLYSMLALEYLMFKYNLQDDFKNRNQVLDKKSTDSKPVAPRLTTRLKDIEVEDYNVYDSEYRRIVPVSQLGFKRRLSDSEIKIKNAIDFALAADKTIIDREKAAQRELARKKAAENKRLKSEERAKAAEKKRREAELKKTAGKNYDGKENS